MARRRTRIGLVLVAVLLVPHESRADGPQLSAAKACRKTISTQGRVYAKKRAAYLLACADRFLKCELLQELDGLDARDCRARTFDACTRKIGPAADAALAKTAARFTGKSGAVCLAMSYADVVSTGPGGLRYGDDVDCGASVDLPSLLDCVRDRLEAGVDATVSQVKPRAGVLFDNVGLGSGYPNLTRPPFQDVVVAATAAGSGALVGPGTINVPAGTAVRFSADAATLPCGNGMNGRLTIRTDQGGIGQAFELREPYAPTDVAIVGPYVAAGTVPYTIELKDGACDDTATGDIVVP